MAIIMGRIFIGWFIIHVMILFLQAFGLSVPNPDAFVVSLTISSICAIFGGILVTFQKE